MQAIILAGGFGKRLQSVVSALPKPMAPIGGKPFLAYLLDYLQLQGVTRVILSVHHLHETIQSYFANAYRSIDIVYAIEDQPLGTGGAIVHALKMLATKQPVWVLNGDSFIKLDYRAMYQQHQTQHAKLTIALRPVKDCLAYGKVSHRQHDIISFQEKSQKGPGLINAGVYLLQANLFENFSLPSAFSFETDFLQAQVQTIQPKAYFAEDYFIDIGIPEAYARAERELPLLMQ